MRLLGTATLVLLAAILAGCASSKSGDVYTRDQARTVHTVKLGVVESVRTVRLEGTKTPVGTAAGAVVGGVAGSAAEEGITRKDGIEITVKLDNGTMLAVVQEATAEQFNPGERVRVLEGGGVTRVTH